MNNKLMLLIIDGMGLRQETVGNAVTESTMPYLFDRMAQCGVARLEASGEAVGLAADQAGNSEVGHATIGAGRVLRSKLAHIENEYSNGNWFEHCHWKELREQSRVHIAGILSDAGVHAHIEAMQQTVKLAVSHDIKEINVHVFLDGIDAPANSAPKLLDMLADALSDYPEVRMGVIMGRIWAADRSGDLSVTQQCVNALTHAADLPEFTRRSLHEHISSHGSERDFPAHRVHPGSGIREGEHIILTNHRSDRVKQLCQVLLQSNQVYTLADLSEVAGARVFFPQEQIDGGLIERVLASGKRVEVVAEACKFKHVTYFLNGFKTHAQVVGKQINTIDDQAIRLNPSMSIDELEAAIMTTINDKPEFICVNIPNLDQVGHTGDLSLTEQAAKCVDASCERVIARALREGYQVAVTADHGNADKMQGDNGEPLVSHSSSPVPFFVVTPQGAPPVDLQPHGSLANIAPTLLKLMTLPVPQSMHVDIIQH